MPQFTPLDAPFFLFVRGSVAAERLAHMLLANGERPAFAEDVSGGVAVVRFANTNGRAILVRRDRDTDGTAKALIEKLLREATPGGLEAVVLDDAPEAGEFLRSCMPKFPPQRIDLFRLGLHGGVETLLTQTKIKGPLAEVLEALVPIPPSEEEWNAIGALRAGFAQAVQEQVKEQRTFVKLLQARRPYATWALLGLMLVLFAVELAVGATDSTMALRRLGANVPELILEGQWWRVVAATFLHGDVKHVAFNLLVLWGLGTFLERILGTPRFVLIYLTSALAGGVASTYLLEANATGIGASGALWGLLAADAILAFRPNGLLPAAMVQSARTNALTNLALNLVASFRPGVDFYAHFAGGAAAAVLVGTGLVLQGLPRLDEAEQAGGDADARLPGWIAPLAGVLTAVFLVGLGLAITRGKVWEYIAPPTWTTVELAELDATAQVPAQVLGTRAVKVDDGATDVTFGDMRLDPALVEIVSALHEDPLDDAGIDEALEGVATGMKETEAGQKVLEAAKREVQDGVELVTRRVQLDNGLTIASAVRVTPYRWFRIDTLAWPEEQARWSPVSRQIGRSIVEKPRPAALGGE